MTEEQASLRQHLAGRLRERTRELCERWLERLNGLVDVPEREIFPTDLLIDHVPELLVQVANDLAAPASHEAAANSVVVEHARALGELRHDQDASVHQILSEYGLLSEVIHDFFQEELTRLETPPTPADLHDALSRLHRSVRILMCATVDTFVDRFATTIDQHRERLAQYHRILTHDVRNPVNTLRLTVEVMDGPAVGDEDRRRELVDRLRRNVEKLEEVLRDGERRLEEANESHDGQPHPVRQHLDLGGVASHVQHELKDAAREGGVEIRVAEGLPCWTGDLARLERILLNVVANAIQRSRPEPGDGVVEIRAETRDEGGVRLEVTDDGRGIPAEERQRAFERGGEETSREHSHLGLAIARECAEELGGSIAIEPREGGGTRVVVTLPSGA